VPAATDWRPYQVTTVGFVAALLLNLATGNDLWLDYTLIGFGLFLLAIGIVRLGLVRPPSSAVWAVGLTAALHYGGGSLSGLHQMGGPNGAYYVFPWWDNVVHVVGSASLAVAAFAILRDQLPEARRGLVVFLAAASSALVGTLAELYEFTQFVFLGTVDQGFYTNNLVDLYNNVLGAALGAGLYAQLESHRVARVPTPAASPA
jgi:energy-converting hydrogenase Eha subunit H